MTGGFGFFAPRLDGFLTAEQMNQQPARNGRIRTAAVRRLIATHRAEYRALLREERARLGGGANAA
jgi:hypothetical protein